jgi:DnaJ-domain-containing protein 1
VKDGYLLLEDGLVVGHHSGETRPDNVRYSTDDAVPEDDPVLRDLARSSSREAQQLRQLLAYFLPVIQRKQQAAGFRSEGFRDRPRESTPPPPPRTPEPAPPAEDPYTILGIARTATDDEVKDAWRTQLKLNHPDKVAHLSPALQKFAEQQTLAVMKAYETIVAMRRR